MRQSHASYSRCGLGSGEGCRAVGLCWRERSRSAPLKGAPTRRGRAHVATRAALTRAYTLTHMHIAPSCALSCCSIAEGTCRLVELVQQEQDAAVARGEEPALYGAKITGGGCGGGWALVLL